MKKASAGKAQIHRKAFSQSNKGSQFSYEKIPLRPIWLIRNRDLSRTVLNQTSCSMFITHYAEDGSRESHEAYWDEKKKRFSYRF
jgi:hypothetical protein